MLLDCVFLLTNRRVKLLDGAVALLNDLLLTLDQI